MAKFYFSSLFILFLSIGFSQNYPYLNASTGNAGQYAVDKDTNIFMYHGSRLEKLDKNFNQIWVNTYSNFGFQNILLSKTGCIFFIGNPNKFGKINPDGSLNWIKSLATLTVTTASSTQTCSNVSLRQLFLDRNNNLVYSGTLNTGSITCGFFLKTDTLGTIIKMKLFQAPIVYGGNYNFTTLNLMNDINGNYNLFTYGTVLGGNIICVMNFSDMADSLNVAKYGNFFYPYSIYNAAYYKSKNGDSHYFATTTYSVTESTSLIKFNSTNVKWGSGFNWAGSTWFWGFDETDKGDILFTTSTSVTSSNFNAGYVKMDSNGIYPPKLYKHFSNYPVTPSFPYNVPACRLNAFYGKKYFIEAVGAGFSSNPLTLGIPDSTLNMTCSNTISISNSVGGSNILSPNTIPKTISVISYTLTSITSSATAITNYTVNTDFCNIMGEEEFEQSIQLKIYPNPVNDKLHISEKNYAVNSMEIFDVNGKSIKSITKNSSVDVSNLPGGIYFIRIKTDKGECHKKFIKE